MTIKLEDPKVQPTVPGKARSANLDPLVMPEPVQLVAGIPKSYVNSAIPPGYLDWAKAGGVDQPYRFSRVYSNGSLNQGSDKKRVRDISPGQQATWLHELVTIDMPKGPLLVSLGGTPTDQMAMRMAVAVTLFQSRSRDHQSIKCVSSADLGDPGWRNWDNRDHYLFLIYNVSPLATPGRKQYIRDFIVRFNNSLIIVVVSGAEVLDYFENQLFLVPTCAIQIDQNAYKSL